MLKPEAEVVEVTKQEKKPGKEPKGTHPELERRVSLKKEKKKRRRSKRPPPPAPEDHSHSSTRRAPKAVKLRIDCGETTWIAQGRRVVEPVETRTYFSSLSARYKELQESHDPTEAPRVVSVCIPCFNEEASSLKRTLGSLQRCYLPPNVVLEILVVMDGTQQIVPSMAAHLQTLFGISVFDESPQQNPFMTFPNAQTVIVESVSNERLPISLLIKRTNKRKVNSQRWWLYGHAKDTGAEFAFATDCGIVFDRKCLLLLLERMIRQPNLSGLTGYQRVMSAQMQGDGTFEFCADPMGYFLRQMQSFDFDVSNT
jgi:cellulose synthase/poly-beta-1,6-N-acetylglucosamine synthase-like glycosyltransferase